MTGDDPDLHALTAAYALNALPEDERVAFEAHLEVCEPCALEAAEFLATTAQLGAPLHEPAPPALKARILDEVARTPQASAPSAGVGSEDATDDAADTGVTALPGGRAGPPSWVTWVSAAAAAVAAVVVIAMGVQLAAVNDRLEQAETLARDAADQLDEVQGRATQVGQLLAASDVETISYDGAGIQGRLVVSAERGEAVFVASGLDPAPHQHTYELWVIGDEGPTPAGLFDVEDGTVTQLVEGDFASAAAVGVTVEPAGGSPEPTTDPIMVMDLQG